MSKKVLSLGALAMDTVLEGDRLAENDGFSVLKSETVLPGGSAANVSTALSGLGVKVYQTGQVGDDSFGIRFKNTLDGVDTTYLKTRPGGTTLHTYVVTAPEGAHCIYANLGDSVSTMEPDEELLQFVEEVDCLYVDLFSAKAALALAYKAKEHRIPIVYNMQCAPSFMKQCHTTIEQIEEMLRLCDLLISGQESLAEMTGEVNFRDALRQIQQQYDMKEGVICTRGKDGSFWWDGREMYKAEAFPVKVVDTTGAGDCFTGAVIYAYLLNAGGKQEAIKFANGAAALKCLIPGARNKASAWEINELILGI